MKTTKFYQGWLGTIKRNDDDRDAGTGEILTHIVELEKQLAAAKPVIDAAIEWRKHCGEGEPNAFAQAALVEAIDTINKGE